MLLVQIQRLVFTWGTQIFSIRKTLVEVKN